jgi:hypothetical protein
VPGAARKRQYAGYKLLTDLAVFKEQFTGAAQKTYTIRAISPRRKTLACFLKKLYQKGSSGLDTGENGIYSPFIPDDHQHKTTCT